MYFSLFITLFYISKVNKLQLLCTLRKHIKLSEKRSMAYGQNKAAKFLIYIGVAFILLYMLFIAVLMAMIANSPDSHYTSSEFFFGIAPLFLAVDFLFRFIGQQTPSQLIKPYSLLPIPKYTCVELFVYSSMLSSNNLVWLVITIPYVIMTTLFSAGFSAALGLVIAFQLLVIINSQWYMLIRTLINQTIKWWALPAVVYALIFSLIYIDDFRAFFDFYTRFGSWFAAWNLPAYIGVATVLVAFIQTNKRVQYRLTYSENAGVENTKLRTVSEFHVFDKYGETGQYLKLEIKSIMRNKNMRKSFIFGTVFVTILSLVISFTDIYDSNTYKAFWVVYTFVLYGSMFIIKIMSAEGNYIDGLMIHKENIMHLLKAKYYLYGAMLLFPLLLMLPTVFMGKYTLLSLIAMMTFTAGPIYCLLMQMAVYNRQTIPLNTKFISKGNIENNYFQVVAELVAMFCPVIFISVMNSAFPENTSYIILLVLGLVFIVTHQLWIKNIYRRFMKRRYQNMESFRATR